MQMQENQSKQHFNKTRADFYYKKIRDLSLRGNERQLVMV